MKVTGQLPKRGAGATASTAGGVTAGLAAGNTSAKFGVAPKTTKKLSTLKTKGLGEAPATKPTAEGAAGGADAEQDELETIFRRVAQTEVVFYEVGIQIRSDGFVDMKIAL